MKNATKEYILVTLLHEGIHAYIDFCKSHMDSSEFNQKFPIYAEFKNKLSNNEIAQHNEMANNYVKLMAGAIRSYNSDADSIATTALAWGGLQHTDIWKSKSDTNQIKTISFNSRNADMNQYVQYKFQKCPTQ